MSVTAPLKREALELADTVTDRARLAGGANTLVRDERGWRADNTDLPGAVAAIRERHAGAVHSATILGAAGQFAIRGGVEVKVGRDPAQCPIVLGEPRVSGVHATLKFEGGQLLVRDEGSNNGTYVNGARIPPATWTPIPRGTPLRFGPVEFSVRID